jgi:DNA mismatch endonuclease, patch repair protein
MDHAKDRSRWMASIRTSGTHIEAKAQEELRAVGIQFRTNVKGLPGSPDILIETHRLAVFIHGCFWHMHCCPRGKLPATNKSFWTGKLQANRRRDARNLRKLRSLGWGTVTIWGCDVDGGLRRLFARL